MLTYNTIIAVLLLLTTVWSNDNFMNKFHQNDYKMKFTRAGVDWYNDSYYSIFTMKSFKYNRTQIAINITFGFKIDMNSDLVFECEFYKFTSNEYRVFPILLQLNYCTDILRKNVGGLGSGTLQFNQCPLKKGDVYSLNNFYPDEHQFPPYIPSGEFKMAFKGLHVDKHISTFYALVDIYRPIRPRK